MTDDTKQPFAMQRLGLIMEPDPANPDEVLGVLNPACCRDRDGELLLFPRVVAAGNYSRVGIARVLFDAAGDPRGVERAGYALEPRDAYERNPRTAGVEDPRITFIPAIDRYVMAYAAYGPLGPRVALAISDDARSWQRLGVAKFGYAPEYRTDFDMYVNKDAYLFPEPVRDPHGRLALAMIHRPDYGVTWWSADGYQAIPHGVAEPRPSMWISYAPLEAVQADLRNLCAWSDHHLLAASEQPWEALKIGGGTPPVLTAPGMGDGLPRRLGQNPVGRRSPTRGALHRRCARARPGRPAQGAVPLAGADPGTGHCRRTTRYCQQRRLPHGRRSTPGRAHRRLLWHGRRAHRRGADAGTRDSARKRLTMRSARQAVC